jgi:MerR family transcriptional regulator, light-induced transcriptional regulator
MEEMIVDESLYRQVADTYLEALLQGDRGRASDLVFGEVDKGTSVKDIYLHVFQASQHRIGELWQDNRISVAQEHFCTAATQVIMSQLYPLFLSGREKDYRMVATCVGGELHELGVRMVADFFEMEGWDTYFLGANTPEKSIIESIESFEADLLAVSVSMTFNVGLAKELIRAVRNSSGAGDVKILVGGRPFNVAPELWKTVDADGYAPDAAEAIRTAESLVRSRG